MIGNGSQAEFQALAMKRPCIDEVRLYDVDPNATEKMMRNLENSGLRLVACASSQEAVNGAQIVTTCTADKAYATILTDNMIGAGVHINAIGGDCPGKTELHKDILKRAQTFVEFEPKHVSKARYSRWSGLPCHRVLAGAEQERRRPRGHGVRSPFSTASARRRGLFRTPIRSQQAARGRFLRADRHARRPDDPRDLYGMLQRAA
jgi:ornithine cyclodeaminase